ncbi:MAG: alpha-amylase, partial [Flavobacteriales bacterium]|nr:alpha-amylase [Flavobacteriales bacterium]
TLTRKLKEKFSAKGKFIYQIGETYGSPELIGSYVNTGQLDAQFDFNLYDALVATLCREEVGCQRIVDELEKSLDAYGHHHLMGNITGNQDRGRFISYAGGALRFDENAKVAGWTREVGVGDEVAYNRSQLLMALISTLPGLPVIYYGDEIGSYGGNDPDNRKMMRFSGLSAQEEQLKQMTSELLNYRKNSLPLIYGDIRIHQVEGNMLVYSRNYLGESVYVLINTGDESQQISLNPMADQSIPEESFRSTAMSSENGYLTTTLPPHSFEILY